MDDLSQLAIRHNVDKWNSHWYTQHYHAHFNNIRNQKLNILEIGVGGYENPLEGGNSLRMWRDYFPNSTIYSIDIYDKRALAEPRIKIYQGSQTDETVLMQLYREAGVLDVIIDDGSHVNEHVIITFQLLFPLLRSGGIYAVEDTQTSYWPYLDFGGDSDDLDNASTMMNFFKRRVDGLNYEELIRPGYEPSYFDRNIVSMHFYHNLVLLYKGKNEEGSNFVINNTVDHLL